MPSVDYAQDQILQQYILNYSLVTGNGGTLFFCGEKCVLSLSDLPGYVYQRVNDYVLSKSSFSYNAICTL